MRRKLEDFLEMELQELFDEILNLEGGDLWDGFSSRGQKNETYLAKKAFGIKMRELGVRWE